MSQGVAGYGVRRKLTDAATPAPLKQGDWRMTVITIASGQAANYGPTRYHYRVYFEWVPWLIGRTQYEPAEWAKEVVENHLRGIKSWCDKPEWHDPTLEFIKKVAPGTWEFKVTEAYTD